MHIVIHDDDTIVQGDGNTVQGSNGINRRNGRRRNETYRVKGARRRQRRKKRREEKKEEEKEKKKVITAKLLDSNQ